MKNVWVHLHINFSGNEIIFICKSVSFEFCQKNAMRYTWTQRSWMMVVDLTEVFAMFELDHVYECVCLSYTFLLLLSSRSFYTFETLTSRPSCQILFAFVYSIGSNMLHIASHRLNCNASQTFRKMRMSHLIQWNWTPRISIFSEVILYDTQSKTILTKMC